MGNGFITIPITSVKTCPNDHIRLSFKTAKLLQVSINDSVLLENGSILRISSIRAVKDTISITDRYKLSNSNELIIRKL